MRYIFAAFVLLVSVFVSGCGTPNTQTGLEAPIPQVSYSVYFFNQTVRPIDLCDEVVPVPRFFQPGKGEKYQLSKESITALFTGPTEDEKKAGYITQIPAGTDLKNIVVKDGLAIVDVSEQVNQGGGSCAMLARRTQIERTLLQFPDIKAVKITVNGDSETVLQP